MVKVDNGIKPGQGVAQDEGLAGAEIGRSSLNRMQRFLDSPHLAGQDTVVAFNISRRGIVTLAGTRSLTQETDDHSDVVAVAPSHSGRISASAGTLPDVLNYGNEAQPIAPERRDGKSYSSRPTSHPAELSDDGSIERTMVFRARNN